MYDFCIYTIIDVKSGTDCTVIDNLDKYESKVVQNTHFSTKWPKSCVEHGLWYLLIIHVCSRTLSTILITFKRDVLKLVCNVRFLTILIVFTQESYSANDFVYLSTICDKSRAQRMISSTFWLKRQTFLFKVVCKVRLLTIMFLKQFLYISNFIIMIPFYHNNLPTYSHPFSTSHNNHKKINKKHNTKKIFMTMSKFIFSHKAHKKYDNRCEQQTTTMVMLMLLKKNITKMSSEGKISSFSCLLLFIVSFMSKWWKKKSFLLWLFVG